MIRSLLIHLSLACAGFSAMSPALSQEAPATNNPPGLTLLNAGAAPRRELRYSFDAESAESAAMDMTINMNMSLAGMQIQQLNLPAIRMVIDLGQIQMSSDDTARYEFEISPLEPVANADTDPNLANAVRASLGDVPSISGWARINSRGFTLEGGVDPIDGIDPQLNQVFDSAQQSLQQMSAPLPEEAVGVGGEWQVVQDMRSGGFDVSQTTQYRIVAMEGDSVTLELTMTQTAPSQAVELPGAPGGAGANLNSLESTGSGSMQIDLARFMPRSDLSISMAIALGITAGGGNQQIDMAMETDMSITPIE